MVKLMLDVKSEKLYTSDCSNNGSGVNDSTEVAETTPSSWVVTFWDSVLWPLIVTPVSCYTVLSLTVLLLSLLISCTFSFISVHFFFRACSAWADIRESGCLFRKSKSQDDRSDNYQSI
ncbi:hypothetical protein ACOMHN_023248 [Nucella lapillus]